MLFPTALKQATQMQQQSASARGDNCGVVAIEPPFVFRERVISVNQVVILK
jgi:hypothetical protein